MTDLWDGALIDTAIWHGRTGDVTRDFRYRATYLAMPVRDLDAGRLPVALDRRSLWSIRHRDHGAGDGAPLQDFITAILTRAGLAEASDVTLIALPRTLGYGFNPVAFWLCRDGQGQLRAVLAEVRNTFGERHLYLCHRPDLGPVTASDRLSGEKLFHVSPFLPRRGRYVFRFDAGPGRFGAWVDWLDSDGTRRLGTSMTGPARPLTHATVRRAALCQPLQAQKVIALIHWQAAKLFGNGVPYLRKPPQKGVRASDATRPETRP